jgi:hypothetical protein
MAKADDSGKNVERAPAGHPSAPVLKLGNRLTVLQEGVTTQIRRGAVDLCFVFDTTGSMMDKIDGLVRCMALLVADLGKLDLDWRVVTVPFGDLTVTGDRVVTDQPFVADVAAASHQLRSMPRFSGGGNLGESSVEAMLAACRKPYRAGAVKILVLITDEPALGHQQGARAVDQALTALDAVCFSVTPDLPYYRQWAANHGGDWRQVAAAVDTRSIMRLFQSLLSRVASVADSVHRLGDGSVRKYLERGGG